MNNETNTSQTITGADDVGAAVGAENDSEVVNVKDVLKEVLGRDYKSDEDALKSVKETFDFVGKLGSENKTLKNQLEELKTANKNAPEILSKVAEVEKRLNESNFYTEHPEYKPYKGLIAKNFCFNFCFIF
mgnify:CR=1 FL=1